MPSQDQAQQASATLKVSLDPATPPDVPTLLEWMRDMYQHEGIAFEPAAAEASLRELLDHPEYGRVYLLGANGKAVGYAVVALGFSLEFGGRSAFLDELYVRPSSRGRGTGSIALRLLQSACRSMGARSLALEVHLENARAEALYRREGFVSNGRQLMTRRL
jgi:ribosomal protein S18 acetylase RimI-like enzyme